MNVKCANCQTEVPRRWVEEFGTCDSCERPLVLNKKSTIESFFDQYKYVIDFHKSKKTTILYLVEKMISLGYDPATALTLIKSKLKD